MVADTATLPRPSANGNGLHKENKEDFLQTYREVISEVPPMRVPYSLKLSFAPLLRHWHKKLDSDDIAERLLAREIISRAQKAPEFWEPIEDYSMLEKHPEFISLLMAGLFPLNLRDTQLGKAGKPFDMQAFYFTPALTKMLAGCKMKVKMDSGSDQCMQTFAARAGAVILNQHYGQNLDVDPTFIYSLQPAGCCYQNHYKTQLNIQYIEVIPVKPLKKLSKQRINKLLSNIYDVDAWLDALPAENFEIHGIIGVNMIDVTKEETLSRLRFQLLEKDAVVKPENITRLEEHLKGYFGMPDLRLGLMALDYPGDRQREYKYKIRHCFLSEQHDCLLDLKNANSVYDKACKYKETLLVEDLEELAHKTPIEKGMIEKGIRSYLVAPLLNKQGDIIGILEVGSPNPYELNSFAELDFKELLPLFNMAVERSREETDNQIEAIIREKFTAIHPSVEWRFVESAFNYLDKAEKQGKKVPVEQIVFEDVFPLYAQSDIVSSSVTRNRAIQEDFTKNLELIKSVLEAAVNQVDFPLLHHYLLETEHRITELKTELRSSDESLVMEFIQKEIHPLFDEMARRDGSLALAVANYYSQLDKHFGVVYRKRKDYEESVNRINTAISDYLEHQDDRAQRMIPHYFERYKTDGVQFEIYAGQSLLQTEQFSHLHLRNLRLWQLLSLCDITRQMETLKSELPMPLSTAQLVFVYGQPISIRFRQDDKRFDVDGAYNIRYEIIKKRIDKATLEGSEERLTQPGKIAIVYASEKDYHEYMEYLTYLVRQGLIEDKIEELVLDKLQGVQGLRALRVAVKI